MCQEQLRVFILIFVLLYANDTIILAESASDLHNCLIVFENCCTLWKSLSILIKKLSYFSKEAILSKKFKLYDLQ